MILKEVIEMAGLEAISYRGQSTLFKPCLGVIAKDVIELAVDLAFAGKELDIIAADTKRRDDNLNEVLGELRFSKWDRMGSQFIVYWPEIEYVIPTKATTDGASQVLET